MRKFIPLSELWEDEEELPFILTNFFLEDLTSSHPTNEEVEEEYRSLFTHQEEQQDFFQSG